MRWLPQIDYGIVGEAFETFPELVEELENKENTFQDISKIKGITYRLGEEIKISPTRPLLKDLDQLRQRGTYSLWRRYILKTRQVYLVKRLISPREE